jgi:PAS domain S-box-containing protein
MTAGKDSRHQTSPVTTKQFESLVCAATDAILGVDHQGNITIWNAAATKMFGYKAKEAIDMSLHDLLVPRHMLAKANKGFEDFVETGQGLLVGKITECIALRKYGSEFPVELSISSFQQNDHWHATGIVRDITERKRVEEKLKQKLDEIERMNRLMVGRELKMEELRKEIRRLKDAASS